MNEAWNTSLRFNGEQRRTQELQEINEEETVLIRANNPTVNNETEAARITPSIPAASRNGPNSALTKTDWEDMKACVKKLERLLEPKAAKPRTYNNVLFGMVNTGTHSDLLF